MYIQHVANSILIDYTYSTFKRLGNKCIWPENASSISAQLKCHYFFCYYLVMFAFISDVTINKTMASYLCKIL